MNFEIHHQTSGCIEDGYIKEGKNVLKKKYRYIRERITHPDTWEGDISKKGFIYLRGEECIQEGDRDASTRRK